MNGTQDSSSEKMDYEKFDSVNKNCEGDKETKSIDSEENGNPYNANEQQIFRRRFQNPDMATCWLNSCLQLVLSAMDQNTSDYLFNSELGVELKRLQLNHSRGSLDPTNVKDILVTCEDTRIATRLSELESEINNQEELEKQCRLVQSFRLNLRTGQQCVRDFFVLLNENIFSWPDIYAFFAFQIVTSTTCSSCKMRSESESTQIYEEMPVPPDQSSLKFQAEQFFNESLIVESQCQDGCKERGLGERRTTLKSCRDSKFIILIFSRAVDSELGYQLVTNSVICTDPINIR